MNLVLIQDERIINELSDHVRVNTATKSIEFYNEHGVKMVLRNLSDESYEAFKNRFQNF